MKKIIAASLIVSGALLGTGVASAHGVGKGIGSRERPSQEQMAEHKAMMEKTTRTVEKLSNGVKITITSDDPAVVTKIKEQHAKMQEKKQEHADANKVTHTSKDLTNGVELTITSDDAQAVQRIQEHAEHPMQGKKNHFKRGNKPFFKTMTPKSN